MIKVVKAKVHNLKEITVEIPHNSLTVITGVSGSGKSSLAFDTIYAEGQRRYLESLSSYARQFLQQLEKPDVEEIQGLSPTIAIQQKVSSRNPRSTVGTVTEIYDYFRLLYAAIGKPHCPNCGKAVSSATPDQIVDYLYTLPKGSRLTFLAPIVRGRKGEFQKVFEDLKKEGFYRVRVDGSYYLLEEGEAPPNLDLRKKHDIEVAIDRTELDLSENQRSRFIEAIELSFKLAKGQLCIIVETNSQGPYELFFNRFLRCSDCEISLPELKPRLFSFNSPYGACPKCSGIGYLMIVDPDLLITDKTLSILEGAISLNNFIEDSWLKHQINALAKHYKFSLSTPFKDLPQKVQNVLLYGSGNEYINVNYNGATMKAEFSKPFEGLVPMIERRYRETQSDEMRSYYEKFMRELPCPECDGKRLSKSALAVTINGINIYEMTEKTVAELVNFFNNLQLSPREFYICKKVLEQIKNRLNFLMDVGLDYLTLNRAAHTLSGGEAQRIRLATQIGSGLVGITYVLDEPSIGLHARDNSRLIQTLKKLKNLGNTVIVVEHDREIMFEADHIIDLGPLAGKEGGYVVATGTAHEIAKNEQSITGKFLSGVESIPVPSTRRKPAPNVYLEIEGCTHNNLKNINVKIPLGCFVAIAGVSGSGKSSLIIDTLYPALANKIYKTNLTTGSYTKITGLEHINKVINVDQEPIGKTPRSNPATYTGVLTPIRELFAQTPDAKMRGYTASRFSFNVRGGRCEVCEGSGQNRIEMHFLPDVYVICEQCQGKRFNEETLKVKFKGKNIAEVLEMSVKEAIKFFENFPTIKRKLQTLCDVGLGYITLGQPSTTLSGGEAQRIKLASELSKVTSGKTVYILDEPTTGLHFADIKLLINVLNRLVEKGNTVIVVEHNLEVIKVADWIIELGPEGGEKGGYIIAEGTPEDIIRNRNSITGPFLINYLTHK